MATDKSKETMRLALEALDCIYSPLHVREINKVGAAMNALREALAEQPAQQEPVAWGAFYFGGKRNGKLYSHCDTKEQIERYIADRHQSDDTNTFRAAPLYTSPPAQRTWVGLTTQEVQEIHDTYHKRMGPQEFAQAIEAKLKEKNT